VGGSLQVGTHGVVGFSSYLLDSGPSGTGPTGDSAPGHTETSIQTLTLSTNRVPGISLGVNVSRLHLNWPVFAGLDASSYWADIGALKKIALPATGHVEQGLTFGGSLLNVTGSQIQIADSEEALPTILRLGVSYGAAWFSNSSCRGKIVEGLVAVEYQDLVNSKYYGTVRAGAEVKILEMLALRAGYYKERVIEYGTAGDFREDLTYGCGLEVPLDKLTARRIPARVRFDMTKLEQPDILGHAAHWPDFKAYSLSANWIY